MDDLIKKPYQKIAYTTEQIEELKRCYDQVDGPKYFMKKFMKIQHPTKGEMLFSPFPYQDELIDVYHNYRYAIALCSRQLGKTTVAAGYILWYVMFKKDVHVLIAAHKYDGAQEIMDRIRYAYEGLPDHIRAGARDYNKRSIRFDNGSVIEAQATTENTGRGKSISLLYLDEFAFVKPRIAREFWTSISPTLSTGGKCIITSTPNTDEDQFANIWFEANKFTDDYGIEKREVGRNGFRPYFADWTAHPDRTQEWADEERSKIGEERFAREHESKFISFEETLVNSTKLAQLESSPHLFLEGHVRWYKKPNKNSTYIVALDPSMGTGGDDAAIQVLELPSLTQVAEWQHNKTPVEGQVRVLKDICMYLSSCGVNNDNLYWSIESNSLGEAVLVVIRDTGEENFPGTFLHDTRRDVGSRNRRKGFITTNKTKLEACTKLKSWLESGRLQINSKGFLSQLKVFVRNGNTYQAKSGEKDDLIMGMVLAIRMASTIAGFDDSVYSAVNSNIDIEDDYSQPLPIIM